MIEIVRIKSCAVHTPDVDLSTFWIASQMIVLVETGLLATMNAMDFIVLSTCNACSSIQLLCHMLSLPHIPLQIPPYESASMLNQGHMLDQAAGYL